MNVYHDNFVDFLKCNNCATAHFGPSTRILFSHVCLHRICEPCYQKVFSENSVFNCRICSRPHEHKDYSTKSREDFYYESDLRMRQVVMQRCYKRPEDFSTEEDYDTYLEQVENLIAQFKMGKELEETIKSSFDINIDQLNTNIVKREQELNKLNDLRKKKDPHRIYNSKIEVEDDIGMIQLEINEAIIRNPPPRYYNVKLPQLKENAHVTIIRNRDEMILAGGYNFDKSYSDLLAYAKLGF